MKATKKPSFIQLFAEFTERAHDLMGATEALVYLNMLSGYNYWHGVEGKVYLPSYEGIAKHSFCNKATVSKAVKKLIVLGLVEYAGESVNGRTLKFTVKDWRNHPGVMAGTKTGLFTTLAG